MQTRSWRRRWPAEAHSGRAPSAPCHLNRLAGETDQADDVLADVADEGLGLGASMR